MSYLNPKDQQMAAEAAISMDRACDIQYEASSNFRISPTKSILVLVINETDCVTALKQAVKYYCQIHIILSKGVIKSGWGTVLRGIGRWLKAGTRNGYYPVTSIEIPGVIRQCACKFGRFFRFCQTLVISENQSEKTLKELAENADEKYCGRKLVYEGRASLSFLATIEERMRPAITITANARKTSDSESDVETAMAVTRRFTWFSCDFVDEIVPSFKFMLRSRQNLGPDFLDRVPLKIVAAIAKLNR